jgi:hypothetical protein
MALGGQAWIRPIALSNASRALNAKKQAVIPCLRTDAALPMN